jgi:hypothetical protein
MSYQEFIKSKHVRHGHAGFDPITKIPPKLHDWQKRVVEWCCRKGRSAIFADCGLGKTAMQLSWCEQVAIKTGRPVLLLCPIAVGSQTIREADKFGISVPVGHGPDIPTGPSIVVLNYESLHKVNASDFGGVCLDESSILKSFTGKVKQQLCGEFRDTPYKLACTATAAPNDHMELGNHAEFLGVMRSNEMLARWFINDTMKAGGYRLCNHAKRDFWRWVASWAVCISKPSDVGGDDTGYDLPPLQLTTHLVESQWKPKDQLFKTETAVSATNLHEVKRATLAEKVSRVSSLVNSSDEAWSIWCDTDYEADALSKAVTGSVEVRGSTKPILKEDYFTGFTDGKYKKLITKPKIGGFGMNWQHCHNAVYFAGFSFEAWYQSIRRHWRFGQEFAVNVHLIASEDEYNVVQTLERKARDFHTMQAAMSEAMKDGMREEFSGRPLTTHNSDNCKIDLTKVLGA